MAYSTASSKRGKHWAPLGLSSIIATMAIVVLMAFSALSLTTARADFNLSEKTAASIGDYYKADSIAEKNLALAAQAARNGGMAQLPKGMAVKKVDGDWQVVYNVPIDKGRELNVVLIIGDGGEVARKLWQVVSVAAWEPDTELHLIKE